MNKRKQPETVSPVDDIRFLRRRHLSFSSMSSDNQSKSPLQGLNPGTPASVTPISFAAAEFMPGMVRLPSQSASGPHVQHVQYMPTMSQPPPSSQSPPGVTFEGMSSIDFTQMLTNQLSNPQVISAFVPLISAALGPALNQVVHNAVQSAVASLITTVNTQQATIQTLQATNDDLSRRVIDLEADLEDLEQYGRRNSLRFHNMKPPSDSNTDTAVVQLCKEKLKVEISADDIQRSHPIGKPNKKGNIQIICRFRNWKVKHSVFSNKKELKDAFDNDDDKVFITEDLTRYRQIIVAKIADAKRSKHIHSFWTNDGRIFIKLDDEGPKHIIRGIRDLVELGVPIPQAV